MSDVAPSATARRRMQTNALVTLLKALPEQQLVDVLDGLGIKPPEQAPANLRKVRRCYVCGEVYPRCRALWSGDHEFEARPERHREGDE